MASKFQLGSRSHVAANRGPSGLADNQKRSQREQKEVSMLPSSRFTLLAAATAATLALGCVSMAHADLTPVLEAEFSGSGTGTGTGNIVQTGGTGTLVATSPATSAIGTTPANEFTSGSGGYLLTTQTAGGPDEAGVSITPTAGGGFNSWVSLTGSGPNGNDNTINGAFDFFFRSNVAGSSWGANAIRVLDYTSFATGSLRLVLDAPQANAIQLQIKNNANGSQTAVPTAYNLNIQANTIYHVAGTFTTAPNSGYVTADLWVVEGNTAISSTSTPTATNTSSLAFTATANFGSQPIVFGHVSYGNAATTMTTEFDQFRIYNGIPTTFSALPTPEPATLGLIDIGGLGILLLGRKRKMV